MRTVCGTVYCNERQTGRAAWQEPNDKLTAAGSKSYGYDSNGNCTSVTVGSSVTSISYDIENRVIGITYPGGATNSFAYNGEDLRTQKVDSTGTQNYVTDGSSPGSPVLKDGNAVYTRGVSEHRGSTSKFYHGDALGSTRGITDGSQSVTDSQFYDAFGNTVSRTGITPTPFGFVGTEQYQTDSDSGLQLLGHRYYDPSIGRFLSSDPVMAGTNWYAYCDNNPLGKTDRTGLEAKEVLPVIHRGINRRLLPPGTAKEYERNPDFRNAVHEEIGDTNFKGAGGRRKKKLSDDQIIGIVQRNLPKGLQPDPENPEVQPPKNEFQPYYGGYSPTALPGVRTGDLNGVGVGLGIVGLIGLGGLVAGQPEIVGGAIIIGRQLVGAH